MPKKIIVANWKMNPESAKKAKKLFTGLKKGIGKNPKVEAVICPPFIYLPLAKGMTLGAQNVFYKEKGAFTGEISPLMLKDLGVKYVIIGHSEAREYLHETYEAINKKIKEVLTVGLKPILCVGENAWQRDMKTQVIERQLSEGLKGVPASALKHITIAYEPVWAIGTGHSCSMDEAMSDFLLIKKLLISLYGKGSANKARILYGGSVSADNANAYITESGADGLLVGGASLNAKEFIRIIKSL